MSQAQALLARFPALGKLQDLPRPVLLGAASAVVAAVVVLLLWSRGPEYSVLFSNVEDRDGGAIVAALGQMNIPYRMSDSGSAILVPKDRVHETRLQLASQGLPKSGSVGFELLDNTRFGASQFTEQVTYQRALEGELSNSIASLHAVQQARVHLAIPRESLFVRERQEPTASVLLNLYPGRTLTDAQVAAIGWLVSSSVPRLNAENVSVVDQNGRLLSAPSGEAGAEGTRRNFINDLEQRTVQRILTLVTPLVGAGNVRAQASADVDFSQREQTSEVYRPNQEPGQAAVRSKQTSGSEQHNVLPPQGVPGALTNQPPPNAVAPISLPPPAPPAQPGAQQGANPLSTQGKDEAPAVPTNTRHDATINYEVDRTISHVKEATGKLRRLSVAVVVNYRPDEDGVAQPLPPEEIENLNRLVKDAMGFSEERGDTLSIVNSRFTPDTPASVPVWEDPDYLDLGMQLLRYLLIALAAWFIWRKIVKPYFAHLASRQEAVLQAAQENAANRDAAAQAAAAAARRASEISRYEDNLGVARELAAKDPRAVAMVLRSWMEPNAKD
ncbi:MAG TPA: flagellar basal-body MS-ring/collar protein FliF [Pusillimonas sp.]|uniref:flagellar basal-body MS-ring/collar protein FliF n=1 Tax=unclassified Pusillimonas TaxID=2640016 RepID=UPI00263725DF|nr:MULTISPECIES: flagellar basal-body MS-ring/collar protein FliF [unclassified Pusillimonas]HLU18560.1 flagellar basal-body MS-ring/collar protein FliF [Pusillimonas sp.]